MSRGRNGKALGTEGRYQDKSRIFLFYRFRAVQNIDYVFSEQITSRFFRTFGERLSFPTTCVRRRIPRMIRSIGLIVRMLRQCFCGNAISIHVFRTPPAVTGSPEYLPRTASVDCPPGIEAVFRYAAYTSADRISGGHESSAPNRVSRRH